MNKFLIALVAILALGVMTFSCDDDDDGATDADSDSDSDSDSDTDADDTELSGTWHYSGSGGYSDTVVIGNDELTSDGDDWSATYDVIEYSNANDTMQLEVVAQTGTEEVVGDIIYMSYVLDGDTVDLYQAVNTDYPEASGGTEGVDYFTYTRQ